MSTEILDDRGLHLPDLVIKGFRGIEDLSISRLGRVTQVSGKNSVGKTTLLDAVRVYAARGRYSVLNNILRTREELASTVDEDGDEILAPDLERLFYGRGMSPDTYISIGPENESLHLSIKIIPFSEKSFISPDMFSQEHFLEEDFRALRIEFQHAVQEIPINRLPRLRRRRFPLNEETEFPSGTLCETVGPGLA